MKKIIKKVEMDFILRKYHVQPAGTGYVDCICPMENAASFIDAMTAANIRIMGFAWWCFVHNGHKPCGMGGPKNEYGDGWFSEIAMGNVHEFNSNEAIKDYLKNYQHQKDYKPCYVPAFWLDMPYYY